MRVSRKLWSVFCWRELSAYSLIGLILTLYGLFYNAVPISLIGLSISDIPIMKSLFKDYKETGNIKPFLRSIYMPILVLMVLLIVFLFSPY